jgi:hypothetical protein
MVGIVRGMTLFHRTDSYHIPDRDDSFALSDLEHGILSAPR